MEPSKEQIQEWHNDANNWKWRMFYVNKKDPRLLVDKPNPNLGATINFAHPKAYLFLAGVLCFFGLVVFTIVLAKK